MCLDIYFFKYRECKESPKASTDVEATGDDSLDKSELRLIAATSGKFQQSDLWC